MYNLFGRTQKQQDKIEAKLLSEGSLWPQLDILHKFIFTRKELNAVKRAKRVLHEYHKKVYLIDPTNSHEDLEHKGI
jgi:hypothetical protein